MCGRSSGLAFAKRSRTPREPPGSRMKSDRASATAIRVRSSRGPSAERMELIEAFFGRQLRDEDAGRARPRFGGRRRQRGRGEQLQVVAGDVLTEQDAPEPLDDDVIDASQSVQLFDREAPELVVVRVEHADEQRPRAGAPKVRRRPQRGEPERRLVEPHETHRDVARRVRPHLGERTQEVLRHRLVVARRERAQRLERGDDDGQPRRPDRAEERDERGAGFERRRAHAARVDERARRERTGFAQHHERVVVALHLAVEQVERVRAGDLGIAQHAHGTDGEVLLALGEAQGPGGASPATRRDRARA